MATGIGGDSGNLRGDSTSRGEPEEFDREEAAQRDESAGQSSGWGFSLSGAWRSVFGGGQSAPVAPSTPSTTRHLSLTEQVLSRGSGTLESMLHRPKVDGGSLSLYDMDQTDILRVRKAAKKDISSIEERLTTSGLFDESLIASTPEATRRSIQETVIEQINEKMGFVCVDEDGKGKRLPPLAKEAIEKLVVHRVKQEEIEFQLRNSNIHLLRVLEGFPGGRSQLDNLSQRLYELACIENIHSAYSNHFSDYARTQSDENLAISRVASEYNASFMDRASVTKAQALLQEMTDRTVEVHETIVRGRADEIASLASLRCVRSQQRVKEDLFKNFYIDSETGKTWEEISAETGSTVITPDTLDRWIAKIQKSYSDGFDRTLSPMERHEAACHLLFTQLDDLRVYLESARSKFTILDDRKTVIVGLGMKLANNNGDHIHVSASGEVTIRTEDGTLVLGKGEEKSLDGGNCTVSLGSEEGSLPVVRYHGDERFEGMGEVPTVTSTWEGPVLNIETAGSFWTAATTSRETDLPEELKDVVDPKLIETFILPKIRHNIQNFQLRLEEVSSAKFTTPAELFTLEREVRIEQARATGEEREREDRKLDAFVADHFHILDYLEVGVDEDALEDAMRESQYAIAHQSKIRFGATTSSSLRGLSDVLDNAKSIFWKRTTNEDHIQNLNDQVGDLRDKITAMERLPEGERSESELQNLKLAILEVKKTRLWYEKEELIAVMQKVIQNLTACNSSTEAAQPKDVARHKASLEEAYGKCAAKLRELEKELEDNLSESKDLRSASFSAIPGSSLMSLLMDSGQAAILHLKEYWHQQPSIEEMNRRRALADIGYNMVDGLNLIKSDICKALKKTAGGEVTLQGFTRELAREATAVLKFMQDNPEMGSTLVADLDQIANLVKGDRDAALYLKRIRTQVLSHAFLRGVPGDEERPMADPETIKRMQAICDAVRILVPLTGAASEAFSPEQRSSVVRSLVEKVPYVGGVASRLVGAAWGALSSDFIRYSVNNIKPETREGLYTLAEAYTNGAKGVIQAQANLDIATSAGELTKALTDEGNFFTSFARRAGRALRHVFIDRLGALVRVLREDSSTANRLCAFVSIAAPVVTGGLALAGALGVSVLSGGIFPAIFFGACAFAALFSNYARSKKCVEKFFEERVQSVKQETQKEIASSANTKFKKLKDDIHQRADLLVREEHRHGILDKDLQIYLAKHEEDHGDLYQEAALKAYAEGNKGDIPFAEFVDLQLSERQVQYLSSREREQIEKECHKEYFQRKICKEFFDAKIKEREEKLLSEAAEAFAREEMGLQSIKQLQEKNTGRSETAKIALEQSLRRKASLPKEDGGIELQESEINDILEEMEGTPDLHQPRFRFHTSAPAA